MLVFVIGKYFKSKPYWYSMLMSLILFLIVFVITYTTAATFYESQRIPEDVSLTELFVKVLFWFTHLSILSSMLFWGLVVMGAQFMLQISDKFGPGCCGNLFLVNTPILKANKGYLCFSISVLPAIAEKLGSKRYFNLLKDFFADITLDILESRGEIYQYVGDEIVISWPVNEGLRHRNCLRRFFRIKQTIQKQSEKYMNQYDLLPDFKAGLHLGDITAGEIGVIKR
jgi:adenylate cyclase